MRYKFRAWDNVADEMIYAGENNEVIFVLGSSGIECTDIRNVSPSGDGVDSMEHLIYMQWTGLTDRNGKEVYEGDILKVPDWYELPENTSMTYNNQVISFEDCSFLMNGSPMHEDSEYISEECEVIGNIYEKEGNK